MARLLGVREYARHRGVSHAAVSKAIKVGRLDKAVKKGKRGPAIDAEVADLEWAANTDPAQQRVHEPEPGGAGEQGSLFRAPREKPDQGQAITMARARATRETLLAQIAHLNLERMKGELVPRKDVETQAFATGRKLRDALFGSVPGLAHELIAIRDPREMERRLVAALTEILGSVAKQDGRG